MPHILKLTTNILYRIFVTSLFLISLPIQILIAILIALTGGFPILYHQKRVGKGGRVFTLYKFRTMVADADRLKMKLRKLNEARGPVFKIHNDPRFTPLGKFLSHTGLDELPQILNVLKGDMSLIGPRPLPVLESKKLKIWQQKRYKIKPGLISPWIVNGYHAQSFTRWMKSDLDYIKHKSIKLDLNLIIKTVIFILKQFLYEVKGNL